ncbi:hypothetical protein [Pseudomonas fluorescens]|uniref:hypothetical protein n=1 Tax=Pseudomonas fluorescens TaxID=294 RepID=UPI001242B596|nr:hypothetical protein [Pseudomonas fluorescens]
MNIKIKIKTKQVGARFISGLVPLLRQHGFANICFRRYASAGAVAKEPGAQRRAVCWSERFWFLLPRQKGPAVRAEGAGSGATVNG